MNGIILPVQQRGQVTLPKKYRDSLGLIYGDHVVTRMEGNKILIESLKTNNSKKYVRKPKVSRDEYLKAIKKMSEYIQKNGPMWTKEDDLARERMRKKEFKKWQKLDW